MRDIVGEEGWQYCRKRLEDWLENSQETMVRICMPARLADDPRSYFDGGLISDPSLHRPTTLDLCYQRSFVMGFPDMKEDRPWWCWYAVEVSGNQPCLLSGLPGRKHRFDEECTPEPLRQFYEYIFPFYASANSERRKIYREHLLSPEILQRIADEEVLETLIASGYTDVRDMDAVEDYRWQKVMEAIAESAKRILKELEDKGIRIPPCPEGPMEPWTLTEPDEPDGEDEEGCEDDD